MANRLNAPNIFASLSPPWNLSQLDANATQNQAAWNDSSLGFVNGICTDTGSANAYVVSAGNLPFGAPSAYNPGMAILLIPANSNTTASTLTVGALGSTSILTPAGNALLGGEIQQGKLLTLVYRSTAPVGFYIVGTCPAAVNVTTGATVNLVCAGCTDIVATVTFTVGGGIINLNNVPCGATATLYVSNTSGASSTFFINVTNAAGTSGTVFATLASSGGTSTTNLSSTGFVLGNNSALTFTGKMTAGANMYLSV